MKKVLSLLLSCMMILTIFAACSNGTPPAESAESKSRETPGTAQSASSEDAAQPDITGETVKFVYVIPGEEPSDYAGAIQEINAKLLADGVGIEAEFQYFTWDVWDQKINLMLSTGEDFDAFHVMNDRVSLANYASRGALADLSDSMASEGANIVSNVPELAMENCQIGGKQYGIPAYWVETALNQQATIRKDILDKHDLSMPETFEELTAVYQIVMENWDGNMKPYFPSVAINDRIPYFFSTDYAFCIYDNLIYVNQDGTVSNYYETETFKEAAGNAKIWYDAGLINPDILTFTNDQLANQLDLGDWFVVNGTVGSIANIRKEVPDITVNDLAWLDLTDGSPAIRPYGVKNLQAVPASSNNPDAAVKFFNWVYADQENFDLFMYGREGTDYIKGENRTYEPIRDETTGAAPYSFAGWMAGNINFGYMDALAPTDVVKHLYHIDENAVDGIASSFAFDASNVQTQLADVQTQISAVLIPMSWGVTDYDSGIDEALDLLKKAGVDDVIAEFQKQLEESK